MKPLVELITNPDAWIPNRMLVACIILGVFYMIVRSVLRASKIRNKKHASDLRECAIIGRDPLLAIIGMSSSLDLDAADADCQIAVLVAARLVSTRKSPRNAIEEAAQLCGVNEGILIDLACVHLQSAASDLRAARDALM